MENPMWTDPTDRVPMGEEAEQGEAWRVSMRAPGFILTAGVLTLLLPGQPVHPQEVPHGRLVEELRLGTQDQPDYTFWGPRALATGADGRVYVADTRIPTVMVFEADGTFVRSMGRRGAGPGEFQAITAIGWTEEGLWVVDPAQARLTVFGLDGALIRTESALPAPVRGNERPARPVGMLRDGSTLWLGEAPTHSAGNALMTPVPLQRRTPGGLRAEPLLWLHRTSEVLEIAVQGFPRAFRMGVPRNHDRWAIAPGGETVVRLRAEEERGAIGAFVLEVWNLQGERVLERRYEHAPVQVTAEERDRVIASFSDRLEAADPGLSRAAAVRRAGELLPIPSTRMVVDLLLVGPDGRIWIHRRDRPGWLTILDPVSGNEIRRIRLPNDRYPGVGVDAVNGDAIWVVEQDSLGIPHLVRYRVEPAGG